MFNFNKNNQKYPIRSSSVGKTMQKSKPQYTSTSPVSISSIKSNSPPSTKQLSASPPLKTSPPKSTFPFTIKPDPFHRFYSTRSIPLYQDSIFSKSQKKDSPSPSPQLLPPISSSPSSSSSSPSSSSPSSSSPSNSTRPSPSSSSSLLIPILSPSSPPSSLISTFSSSSSSLSTKIHSTPTHLSSINPNKTQLSSTLPTSSSSSPSSSSPFLSSPPLSSPPPPPLVSSSVLSPSSSFYTSTPLKDHMNTTREASQSHELLDTSPPRTGGMTSSASALSLSLASLSTGDSMFADHPNKGTSNIKNTCYLNSAIQAISYANLLSARLLLLDVDELMESVRTVIANDAAKLKFLDMQGALVKTIIAEIAALREISDTPNIPSTLAASLHTELGAVYPRFHGVGGVNSNRPPGDAYEALLTMLDAFRKVTTVVHFNRHASAMKELLNDLKGQNTVMINAEDYVPPLEKNTEMEIRKGVEVFWPYLIYASSSSSSSSFAPSSFSSLTKSPSNRNLHSGSSGSGGGGNFLSIESYTNTLSHSLSTASFYASSSLSSFPPPPPSSPSSSSSSSSSSSFSLSSSQSSSRLLLPQSSSRLLLPLELPLPDLRRRVKSMYTGREDVWEGLLTVSPSISHVWTLFRYRFRGLFTNLATSLVANTSTCSKCGVVCSTFQSTPVLCLPLPSAQSLGEWSASLNECFDLFARETEQEVACNGCGAVCAQHFQRTVAHWPKVLFIQIGRLVRRDWGVEKNPALISFPVNFNYRHVETFSTASKLDQFHITEDEDWGCEEGGKGGGSYDDCNGTFTNVYQLVAIINHEGTVDKGHYTCTGRVGRSRWVNHYDLTTTDVPMPRESTTAYVFVYCRR